jgi:hypothetical protein
VSGLYRWLLRAYPADYRRERGLEIVQTFLDAGRSRPSLREAINLVRHGMRARLGRPASQLVVLWASLFSLVCGLFVAAAAVRLAWETAKPLPSKAETVQIFETVLPGQGLSDQIERSPAMFVIYGQPLGPANVDTLFFGDGGEYQFGHTASSVSGHPMPDPRQVLPSIRERLRANGWEEETTVTDAVTCGLSVCDPATLPKRYTVIAHRGDTLLELELAEQSLGTTTYISAELQRTTPWAAHPAGVLGGLLGALAGWLVFGWAGRRTDTAHPAVRTATNTFFGVTLTLWGAPIPPSAILWGADHHMTEPHPRWHPLWEWLGQPPASLLFAVGCGAGLLGLALAALPRGRRGVAEVRSI